MSNPQDRKRRSRMGWMLVLPLAAALPLGAQTFAAGNDGWTTPSGGQTQVNLADMPAVTSALGSPIVGGNLINVQGVPLDSTDLGSMDTLMARGAIASGSGSLTIAALNLVSSASVQLQDGRAYTMQLCLSDTPSSSGSITLTRANGDGGTFSSTFSVLPKLVFTNIHNSSDKVRIDCGGGGCSTLTLTASNAGWVQTGGPGGFDPGVAGVTPMPTGSFTVANCDSTHSVTLAGSSGFYPGFTASSGGGTGGSSVVDPVRMSSASGGGGSFPPSPINHSQQTANHAVRPPQDCLKSGKIGVGPSSASPSPAPVARFCLTSPTMPVN
jgi:hypothetical protein